MKQTIAGMSVAVIIVVAILAIQVGGAGGSYTSPTRTPGRWMPPLQTDVPTDCWVITNDGVFSVPCPTAAP